MNSIGPFKDIVAVNFPTDGVAGQYIFDAIQDMTLLVKNFTGTVNGDPVTINNINVYEYGEIELAEGRNVIKGRQLIDSEPMRIATNYDFQYTSTVENWTLFKFFESPIAASDRKALENYVLDELEKPRMPYPATAFQPGINWLELPAQPSELIGEKLNLMFCGSFGCGDLVNLSMPNATEAKGMFCRSEGTNWNLIKAPKLEDAFGMFAHCRSLWSTNKEPPSFLYRISQAGYMFFGSEIDEAINWQMPNLNGGERFFSQSDIEIISSCNFTCSQRMFGFLSDCSKLNSVIDSIFKAETFGYEFSNGTSIGTWHNNLLESEKSIQFPDEVQLSGANITNSVFSEGVSVYVFGSYFGNSKADILRGDQNSVLIDSEVRSYIGGGLIQNCKIDQLVNSGKIYGEFFGNDIGGYLSPFSDTEITHFYSNKFKVRYSIIRGQNNNVEVEYMDVSGIVFEPNSAATLVSNHVCNYLTGLNSLEIGESPQSLSGGPFKYDSEAVNTSKEGIRIADNLTFITPNTNLIINQNLDIEIRNCSIELTTRLNKFFERSEVTFNIDNSVELYGHEFKVVNSDIHFGKRLVSAGSYVFIDSVLTEPNFLHFPPSDLSYIKQGVVDGCLSYPVDKETAFVCDYDLTTVQTIFFFRNSGVTEVRDFKPIAMTDDFLKCSNLQRIVNSNLYKDYDAELNYVDLFGGINSRTAGTPRVTGDSLVQVAGCLFYEVCEIINDSRNPDAVIDISNNEFKKGFYYKKAVGDDVVGDFFNNKVTGRIVVSGITFERMNGVFIPKDFGMNEAEFYALNSDGFFPDLTSLIVRFDEEREATKKIFYGALPSFRAGIPGIALMPTFEWDGAGDCNNAIYFYNGTFGNRFNFLPREIVVGAIMESAKKGPSQANYDKEFKMPIPGYGGTFSNKGICNYLYREYFETEFLHYDKESQDGFVTEFVDEDFEYISLTAENLAICQQAMFTESDYNYLYGLLKDAGYEKTEFCHYFRLKGASTLTDLNRTYYLPNRIEIIRG